MIIPIELEDVLDIHPQITSGAVRFKGTRVPAQALIDTLDDGDGLAEFLDGYPAVSRAQGKRLFIGSKLKRGVFSVLSLSKNACSDDHNVNPRYARLMPRHETIHA